MLNQFHNLNRFQNTNQPGAYLYATEAESVNIQQSFLSFVEEGMTFSVGTQADDSLIVFNRLQSFSKF